MCGIVGKIKCEGTPVAAADVLRMRDTLRHRGPDDAGMYISPRRHVGLGHRRLSIIDTSAAGKQPLQCQNRYWIVYNGELYNFAQLRKGLQHEDFQFSSHSDTEVVVAMYAKHKERCLRYFRGMFAFAIYDQQEDILFCARDRAGQKPFKYYFDGRTFLFASELKAILTQPEYTAAPDYAAIHHYLTYQYVPAPRTGFANLHKLPPAHFLHLDVKRRRLRLERYWQIDFSQTDTLAEHEWTERIRSKLAEATKMQMVADVPIGAFLSGGVDSSAVVALMQPYASGRLKTFSIGFPESSFNELSYARLAARHFNTEHTEFTVEPKAVEVLPELVTAFEEPYADSSAIPTYYLSQLTRQHVTVALNGDGGDENFAGYARYNFHKLALWLDALGINRIPPSAQSLGRALERLVPNTFTMRAARFLESLPEHPMRRYVTYLCYFTNAMKTSLYQPTFLQQVAQENSYDLTVAATVHAPTGVHQALLADIAMYLPDDLLVKVDIASMLVSLEARSPFLDHEFMELAARVPASLKLRGLTQNKYLLKRSFSAILPASILRRPKMGFVMPIERWFRGSMHSYVRGLLLAPRTRITQEMFRHEAIEKLLQRHTTTATNVAPPLWALLTLELWFRRYFG